MDRRELLKMIALLTGGVVVGSEVFLSGCTNPDKVITSLTLTEADIPFLDEVAETILPATQTPGAKAAKVGQFMTRIVNDCYDENEQRMFRDGMNKINEACKKSHGHLFMDATVQQRHDLLTTLDKETKAVQEKFKKEQDKLEREARDRGDKTFKKQKMPTQYYTLIKQLTLWGYFTSQEALTQALRFTPVPTKWEPCIDYKKGETLFAGLDGV